MRVKNVAGETKIYTGQVLDNNQEYDIPLTDLFRWQTDNDVLEALGNLSLLVGDGIAYKSGASDSINFLLGKDTLPRDQSGRQIIRPSATIEGWHYCLLSVGMTTSKYGTSGVYCKDDSGADLTYVDVKLYDSSGTIIVDANGEANAVKTVITVSPAFSYEILGAIFAQATDPATDIYLMATGAPGIANVKFAVGGINLKHLGKGVNKIADGRASKYMQYVSQLPAANAFKITLFHDAGVQHSFALSFEMFKGL